MPPQEFYKTALDKAIETDSKLDFVGLTENQKVGKGVLIAILRNTSNKERADTFRVLAANDNPNDSELSDSGEIKETGSIRGGHSRALHHAIPPDALASSRLLQKLRKRNSRELPSTMQPKTADDPIPPMFEGRDVQNPGYIGVHEDVHNIRYPDEPKYTLGSGHAYSRTDSVKSHGDKHIGLTPINYDDKS